MGTIGTGVKTKSRFMNSRHICVREVEERKVTETSDQVSVKIREKKSLLEDQRFRSSIQSQE